MKGIIFDIARFSLNDGPGIRTTVFFKGCPLQCKWCHNPESWDINPQSAFFEEKCLDCGLCRKCVNRYDFTKQNGHCILCGDCVKICPNGALKIYGYEIDEKQVFDELFKDEAYFKYSGGGVTLSGGEPLYQPEFALSLLKRFKEAGIHTAIETSGHCETSVMSDVLPYTDLFLFDYKADKLQHKKLTGVDRTMIDANMKFLQAHDANIILRRPIIPMTNYNDKSFNEYINRYPKIIRTENLYYHNMGEIKRKAIGKLNKKL